MSRALLANNASTSLTAAISSTSATTFAIASATGFPAPTAGQYFYATLLDSALIPEIVKVTGVAGLTVTCVRGQDGTTARTFLSGASVDLNLTAAVMAELTALSDVHDAAAATAIRQTVVSGPVDSNGFSAFGGSTGSTTVTASGTLVANAANGLATRVGSTVNPSWTGLTASAYLYLDIASDGTCTTGSTTLLPTYQWGGTYSVTANQFTFNIQEMTGKVGNGTTAAQIYRVFVGEVVASGTVSAIIWYALKGQFKSVVTATLPGGGVATAVAHNLGVVPLCDPAVFGICLAAERGFAVGDVTPLGAVNVTYAGPMRLSFRTTRNGTNFNSGSQGLGASDAATGAYATFTTANWSWFIFMQRGW